MQPFSTLGSRGIFNHVKNYFVALFLRGHFAALSSLRFLSCPESACQSHTHLPQLWLECTVSAGSLGRINTDTVLSLPIWDCIVSQFKVRGQLSERAAATATAAKSLQSCPTLGNPIDRSPPGSPVPGILQARTLEWVAISFSNAWKWKVKGKSSLSHVQLLATHGLQPTRLLYPWDFPGKSTGVGCHCLLLLREQFWWNGKKLNS